MHFSVPRIICDEPDGLLLRLGTQGRLVGVVSKTRGKVTLLTGTEHKDCLLIATPKPTWNDIV